MVVRPVLLELAIVALSSHDCSAVRSSSGHFQKLSLSHVIPFGLYCCQSRYLDDRCSVSVPFGGNSDSLFPFSCGWFLDDDIVLPASARARIFSPTGKFLGRTGR